MSVLSILACASLYVLWVRSYWNADRLAGTLWGSERYIVGAKQGRLTLVKFNWPREPLWLSGVFSYPVWDDMSFPVGDARQYDIGLGFGVLRRPAYMVTQSTFETPVGGTVYISGAASATLDGWGLSVPFWFLVLATGAAGVALSRERPWRFGMRSFFFAVSVIAVVLGLVVALDKPPKNWQLDEPVPLDDL